MGRRVSQRAHEDRVCATEGVGVEDNWGYPQRGEGAEPEIPGESWSEVLGRREFVRRRAKGGQREASKD